MTDTSSFHSDLSRFANVLEAAQRDRLVRQSSRSPEFMADIMAADPPGYSVKVVPGKIYTKVDFGGSGKYMVENATGVIYGIKGYGRVHKGHRYGTLDTIDDWDWSGYVAQKEVKV